ncbi:MAG: Abi family protein [Enterocloster asparagiformis]|nr:Abi family protein [Enterocloster asparagiformis]
MSDIEYANIEKQIEKLKAHNLIISDELSAKQYLELYGYSNLIKSYRDPYIIISDNGKKTFRSDITFEQLCSLYILDKNLRIAVMAAMLDLEEYIKEAVADVIAKSFGTHQDNYLQYRNYQNKKKYKYQFTLTGILETLKKTLDTDKEPIHHYKSKYGIVPPWILFKSVYFSTIINFIDQLKAPEQCMMVKKLYPNTEIVSEKNKVKLMMDTLFISLEYRNIAAHGGRIYNYKTNRDLHFDDNGKFSTEGFCKLLRLLNTLKYQGPYSYLNRVLNRELNRHCNMFPQDLTYLSQILNINITSHQVVWVTDTSSKYHANKHCSGLKHSREIDLEKAIELGFTKCKKCC